MTHNKTGLRKKFIIVNTYLSSPINIVTDIYPVERYNDYPNLFHFATDYARINNDSPIDLNVNGISINKQLAIVKTVMETLERWYSAKYNKNNFIYTSYLKLKKQNNFVINPALFSPFSIKQRALKIFIPFLFDEKTQFHLCDVNNLMSGLSTLIPAQLVYFLSSKERIKEPVIYLPNSSGGAAGFSLEEAIYKGICELIERDAYAIVYHNRLPARNIILESISSQKIQFLIKYLKKYLFDIFLFDIALDIAAPVFLCILVDKTNIGPKISVGVKCDLDWQEAILGSITESLQGINSLRDLLTYKKNLSVNKFNQLLAFNRATIKRLTYWFNPTSFFKLNFLFSGPKLSMRPIKYDRPIYSDKHKLKLITLILNQAGINDIFWKKISPRKLDKFSIYCVKVIVPSLIPLSLDKDFPHLGHQRLFNIPVKLGYKKKPLEETLFNLYPHPLP